MPSFFKKFGVVTGLIEDIEEYKMAMKMAKDGLKRVPGKLGIIGGEIYKSGDFNDNFQKVKRGVVGFWRL